MQPSQVVQEAIDAMGAGRRDAVIALFAEDCVLRTPEGVFEGHDGLRRLIDQRAESGDDMQIETGDLEDVGGGRVLVPLTIHLRMGGEEGSVRATGIWTVVDDRVVEMRGVPGGRRMALAALEDVSDS